MDRIGNYGVYRSNYYDRTAAARSDAASQTRTAGAKNDAENKVQLSEDAKKLLKDIKKKYGNMDFIVADYESDEEAASYLSRGNAEYSVLITPEELEKMASDADKKEQGLKDLDNAIEKLNDVKNQLGDKGEEVSRLGIAMGEDGEVSFFAELEKVSEKQRERIEEKRENNREQAREQKRESVKHTTVHAATAEELAEKISKVDWDKIPADENPSGHRFDLTI